MKGTVKFYNERKKFGFIYGDDGKEYFVHKSNLMNVQKIEAKDSVTFATKVSGKGLVAFDVQVLEFGELDG